MKVGYLMSYQEWRTAQTWLDAMQRLTLSTFPNGWATTTGPKSGEIDGRWGGYVCAFNSLLKSARHGVQSRAPPTWAFSSTNNRLLRENKARRSIIGHERTQLGSHRQHMHYWSKATCYKAHILGGEALWLRPKRCFHFHHLKREWKTSPMQAR